MKYGEDLINRLPNETDKIKLLSMTSFILIWKLFLYIGHNKGLTIEYSQNSPV